MLPRELPLDWWDPVLEEPRLRDAELLSEDPLSPGALPSGTTACDTEAAEVKVSGQRYIKDDHDTHNGHKLVMISKGHTLRHCQGMTLTVSKGAARSSGG